jgi:hypothetical protein
MAPQTRPASLPGGRIWSPPQRCKRLPQIEAQAAPPQSGGLLMPSRRTCHVSLLPDARACRRVGTDKVTAAAATAPDTGWTHNTTPRRCGAVLKGRLMAPAAPSLSSTLGVGSIVRVVALRHRSSSSSCKIGNTCRNAFAWFRSLRRCSRACLSPGTSTGAGRRRRDGRSNARWRVKVTPRRCNADRLPQIRHRQRLPPLFGTPASPRPRRAPGAGSTHGSHLGTARRACLSSDRHKRRHRCRGDCS